MKQLKFSFFLLFIYVANLNLHAQSNIVSYNFNKGEVIDLLLISTKPKTDELFDDYRKTAFPVAMKMSFEPLPSFAISESTQGNHEPEMLIFGKWKNLENREKFITEIETVVPDFHKRRRDIWTIFDLTYYEIPNNLSFKINKDKYNVVTAYWQKENVSFEQFKKEWLLKSNKAGGQIILELTNGKSPFGYYYQPDYFVITQWENKAEFEVFYQENLKMKHKGIQHVNQFVIN